MKEQKQIQELISKGYELGYSIFRSYDLKFNYQWTIQSIDRQDTFYVEYEEAKLQGFISGLIRDKKLEQLGIC